MGLPMRIQGNITELIHLGIKLSYDLRQSVITHWRAKLVTRNKQKAGVTARSFLCISHVFSRGTKPNPLRSLESWREESSSPHGKLEDSGSVLVKELEAPATGKTSFSSTVKANSQNSDLCPSVSFYLGHPHLVGLPSTTMTRQSLRDTPSPTWWGQLFTTTLYQVILSSAKLTAEPSRHTNQGWFLFGSRIPFFKA